MYRIPRLTCAYQPLTTTNDDTDDDGGDGRGQECSGIELQVQRSPPCSLPIVLGSSSSHRRAVMEQLGWQVLHYYYCCCTIMCRKMRVCAGGRAGALSLNASFRSSVIHQSCTLSNLVCTTVSGILCCHWCSGPPNDRADRRWLFACPWIAPSFPPPHLTSTRRPFATPTQGKCAPRSHAPRRERWLRASRSPGFSSQRTRCAAREQILRKMYLPPFVLL